MIPTHLLQTLHADTLSLLQSLIRIPSFSKQENDTADLLEQFLLAHDILPERTGNNVWARNRHFDPAKPTILLNSHHDTVKPNPGYTRDPFNPTIENERLYGLGSNDAGASLTALLAAFRFFHDQATSHNLVWLASAEEEISGQQGIFAAWNHLPPIAWALVGEPTGMRAAIAEKGLMVLDCTATGTPGHAAREEGDNAIYKALPDLEWFRTFRFPEVSKLLGPVKMSVTLIQAGTQHNVVPGICQFTVDVRSTDAYTHDELLAIIRQHVNASVSPRSTRLQPSAIAPDHPAVRNAVALGIPTFGSPTLSDQALIPVPSLKMGPGDSARSHSADEFIYLSEIQEGILGYIRFLESILLP